MTFYEGLKESLEEALQDAKGEKKLSRKVYIIENTKAVRMVIKDQKPTEEQIREIEEASTRPVTPDEDAPELTSEQYEEMAELRNTMTANSGISKIKTSTKKHSGAGALHK